MKGQNKYKEYASRLSNNGKRKKKNQDYKYVYVQTAGPVSSGTAASSAQAGRCTLQARELGKRVNNW